MMIMKTVRRGWLERIFSLSPRVVTKQVRDHETELLLNMGLAKEIQKLPVRTHTPPHLQPIRRSGAPLPAIRSDPSPTEVQQQSLYDYSDSNVALLAALVMNRQVERACEAALTQPGFRSDGGGDSGGAGATGHWEDTRPPVESCTRAEAQASDPEPAARDNDSDTSSSSSSSNNED